MTDTLEIKYRVFTHQGYATDKTLKLTGSAEAITKLFDSFLSRGTKTLESWVRSQYAVDKYTFIILCIKKNELFEVYTEL